MGIYLKRQFGVYVLQPHSQEFLPGDGILGRSYSCHCHNGSRAAADKENQRQSVLLSAWLAAGSKKIFCKAMPAEEHADSTSPLEGWRQSVLLTAWLHKRVILDPAAGYMEGRKKLPIEGRRQSVLLPACPYSMIFHASAMWREECLLFLQEAGRSAARPCGISSLPPLLLPK